MTASFTDRYPGEHILWNLTRLAFVAIILAIMLAFNYRGMDHRDIITMVTVLGGLGGFDTMKRAIAPYVTVGDDTEDAGVKPNQQGDVSDKPTGYGESHPPTEKW